MKRYLFSGVLLVVFLAPNRAQQPVPQGGRFQHTDTMIAMRDGVKLNTAVYVPDWELPKPSPPWLEN